MHPPTAPGWEAAPPSRSSSASYLYLVVALISVGLYAGIMIVGFYLGVCWVQHAINELTLAVRELKTQIKCS